MRSLALEPVGVRIDGLSLRAVTPGAVAELKVLLAEHGVVIAPGQHLDDTAFLGFLQRFGRLTFTTGETPAPGFADLNVVSNVGRTAAPQSTFHVDTSYVRDPPAYTALRAVRIPAQGGETLFTNQYAAYETLRPELRARLAGRTISHVATGVELGPEDEATAAHPVFGRHPISGRTALYISTPKRCAGVSGMSPAEAKEVIRDLYAHSTRQENTYRHSWSPGDVVMWDNRCVLHRADHAGVIGDRVLHRGLIA